MNRRTEIGAVEAKAGRIEQACQRYNLGKSTMRDLAETAGAVIRVGKCVLVNFSIMDAYFDSISGE